MSKSEHRLPKSPNVSWRHLQTFRLGRGNQSLSIPTALVHQTESGRRPESRYARQVVATHEDASSLKLFKRAPIHCIVEEHLAAAAVGLALEEDPATTQCQHIAVFADAQIHETFAPKVHHLRISFVRRLNGPNATRLQLSKQSIHHLGRNANSTCERVAGALKITPRQLPLSLHALLGSTLASGFVRALLGWQRGAIENEDGLNATAAEHGCSLQAVVEVFPRWLACAQLESTSREAGVQPTVSVNRSNKASKVPDVAVSPRASR